MDPNLLVIDGWYRYSGTGSPKLVRFLGATADVGQYGFEEYDGKSELSPGEKVGDLTLDLFQLTMVRPLD